MPATAPNMEPTAKVAMIVRSVLIPMNCAPSGELATARIDRPMRVRNSMNCSAPNMITEATKMTTSPFVMKSAPRRIGFCSR